jgi:hypothetical protein
VRRTIARAARSRARVSVRGCPHGFETPALSIATAAFTLSRKGAVEDPEDP